MSAQGQLPDINAPLKGKASDQQKTLPALGGRRQAAVGQHGVGLWMHVCVFHGEEEEEEGVQNSS